MDGGFAPPSWRWAGPHSVARIESAVAEPRTDRCERSDQRPLHDRRHKRELRLVAVLLRHHGDLQRVREAAPAELAVPPETEELLETFLGPQGGAELDEHVQLVVAVVPEPVDGPSRHHDALAGLCALQPPADPNPRPPRDDLEPLLLQRVDVGKRHRSARAKEIVEREHGTARVVGRPPEHEPFAGDRVLERRALLRHHGRSYEHRIASSTDSEREVPDGRGY